MVSQADFLSLINMTGSVYEAFSSGDENAKVNATKQVASFALSSIWNALSKVDSAKSETEKNEQEAKSLDAEAGKIKDRTTRRAQQKISEIEDNIANIENLLAQLEKNNAEVATYNEQLAQHRQTIVNNQAVVNDPNASREEKKEALDNISAVGGEIINLGDMVHNILTQSTELQSNVQNIGDMNSSLSEESTAILADANQEMEVVINKATTNVTTTLPGVVVTGTKDITKGSAQVAEGTAMMATPATAVVGQQLVTQGKNSITAGNIRTGKSALTMPKLTTTLGTAGQSLATFANFGTSLGSMANTGIDLLDRTGSLWEPFVASTGSWLNVSGSAQEIISQSEESLVKVNSDGEGQEDITLKVDPKDLEVMELSV